jgi:hypothetical protein
MKKLSILSLLALLILGSCKKDTPSSTTCTYNTASVLGSYKTTSLLYKADAVTPEEELFSLYPDCQKDDLLTFNSNGTYTVSEGATSCNPTNADSGTWSVSGNNMILDGETVEIQNFSCSSFKVKLTDAVTGEIITISLAKQ